MSTCIFIDKFDAFTTKYLKLLVAQLSGERLTIFSYEKLPMEFQGSQHIEIKVHENSYLMKSANPQMYQVFFSAIKDSNIQRVIVPRVHFPEYFILDIVSRNLKLDFSIGFFGLSEILGVPSREYLILEFLKQNISNRVILHTIQFQPRGLENLDRFKEFSSQICFVSDPIYEDPESYKLLDRHSARTELKLPINVKVLTFFGAMHFGKGLDILLRAFNYLSEEYVLLIASCADTLNFELDLKLLKGDRIVHLNKFILEEEVPLVFGASDILVLPYRKTYENATSGVIVQAGLAGKPVVVPDISPFRDVIKRFETGYTFKVEDAMNLARVISDSDWRRIERQNHENFVKSFDSWGSIAARYLGA